MKRLLFSAIVGMAVLTACEKKQQGTSETIETTAQKDHGDHADAPETTVADEHADATAGLELDNGKKWKTNTEMLPFILEQEKLIKAYDDDKDDYKILAAGLSAANDRLIKSCTMTGKSHDVLHVWLTNHMDKIQQLAKTENKQDAERLSEDLEHSMETYHQYFE